MGIFMNQALAVEQYVMEREGYEIGWKIGFRKGWKIGFERGRKRGIENVIRMVFTDKMTMEELAQSREMTVDEFMSTCAKSVKIEKEAFVKMCADNFGMTLEEYKKEYKIK